MTVAYSDNLMYNSRVDSSTERKGGFRPPCHINIVRMNTTEVFMIKKVCPICGQEFNAKRNSQVYCSQQCFGKHCQTLKHESNAKDITGQKFGRLTVVKRAGTKDNQAMWLCRCDCGNEIIVQGGNLRNGNTKSCGCYQRDMSREVHTRHNGSYSRLYGVWACMVQRCTNPNNRSYKRYGARDIKVCDEWFDFGTFQEWAMSNGYNPNAKRGECTLDRIDNNNGYSPDNCRWINIQKQCQNTRKNHDITINGETHCMSEWARIYNIKRETIKDRILRLGWDEIKAITTPKLNQKDVVAKQKRDSKGRLIKSEVNNDFKLR